MRKIVFALAGTVSGLIMLFSYHTSLGGGTSLASAVPPSTGTTTTTVPGTGSTGSGSSGSSGTTGGSSGSSGSPGSSGTTGGPGSSGGSGSAGPTTVTGKTAQTQWGPVQVRLTVTDGRITDSTAVQYPNGNGRDQMINSYALPVLGQEVVQQQGANIDLVSGATVTSMGYLQSLQSALDKANL